MVLPLSHLEYRCVVCDFSELLDISTIDTGEDITKTHHDQEMQMILQK